MPFKFQISCIETSHNLTSQTRQAMLEMLKDYDVIGPLGSAERDHVWLDIAASTPQDPRHQVLCCLLRFPFFDVHS